MKFVIVNIHVIVLFVYNVLTEIFKISVLVSYLFLFVFDVSRNGEKYPCCVLVG